MIMKKKHFTIKKVSRRKKNVKNIRAHFDIID